MSILKKDQHYQQFSALLGSSSKKSKALLTQYRPSQPKVTSEISGSNYTSSYTAYTTDYDSEYEYVDKVVPRPHHFKTTNEPLDIEEENFIEISSSESSDWGDNLPSEDPDYDKRKPTPIFNLTEDLRVKIFKYLPFLDRVRAQLVCRLFRFELRVRCGIAAYITDETYWGMTFFRDIIVDTIVVGTFKQPHMTPSELIFRPKLVKQMIFNGPVSIPYMDSFLGRCKSIYKLTIVCTVNDKAPIPVDQIMRREYKAFRKLDTIRRFPRRMSNCKEIKILPKGKLQACTIQNVLELSKYVALQKVSITLDKALRMDEIQHIHMTIFDLIIKCPHIKDIIINGRVVDEEKIPNDRLTLLRPEKEIRETSERTCLRQITFTEELVDFHTWTTFLLEQNTIEVLQVLHLMMYPSLHAIISKNMSTLVKVGMQCILQYDATDGRRNMPLNLSVFGNCPNLKELFVCVAAPVAPGRTDICNFKALPKSLEVLAIRNVTFKARDFSDVVNLPNLLSLGALTIAGTGSNVHNMTNRVLQTMLSMRTLNELLLQGFTLTENGVRDIYIIGRDLSALTRGVQNTIYVRNHECEAANRWSVLRAGSKAEFQFRLIGSHVFEV